jgi:hypothetical protein
MAIIGGVGQWTSGHAGGASDVYDTITIADSCNPPQTITLHIKVNGSGPPDPLDISPKPVYETQQLTEQFTGVGGISPYFFSLSTNNSDGTITSGGLYTAGTKGLFDSVNDTVTVTDSADPPAQASTTFPVIYPLTIMSNVGHCYKSITGKISTFDFTGIGGVAPYTWSITENNSGGSIASTGTYTAGYTPGVDTIQLEDSLGLKTTCTMKVCKVLALTMAPTTQKLKLGGEVTPVLTASLGIGSTQYYTQQWNTNAHWVSDDPTSSSVTTAGVCKQIGLGSSTVTATDVDSSQYATIGLSLTTITDGLLAIDVTGVDVLNFAASEQYTATGVYLGDFHYDLTPYVTWSLL